MALLVKESRIGGNKTEKKKHMCSYSKKKMSLEKPDNNTKKTELEESKMPQILRTTKQSRSKDLLRLENENLLTSTLSIKETAKESPQITRLPISSVFERVKNFLPKMKEAENVLRKRLETSPDDVNIENVENDAPYIEMNLALFECSGDSDNVSSETESESSDEDIKERTKLIEET